MENCLIKKRGIITGIHCIRCKHSIWRYDEKKNRYIKINCGIEKCKYAPYRNWYKDRPFLDEARRYKQMLSEKKKTYGCYYKEIKMVKGKKTKGIEIPEGRHAMKITKIWPTGPTFESNAKSEYDYLQMEVELYELEDKPTLRLGFSFKNGEFQEGSQLDIFCKHCGYVLGVNDEFDSDELLNAEFTSIVSHDGRFYVIQKDTIKGV